MKEPFHSRARVRVGALWFLVLMSIGEHRFAGTTIGAVLRVVGVVVLAAFFVVLAVSYKKIRQ